MKTNKSVQIIAWVLCTAGTVNAQSAPASGAASTSTELTVQPVGSPAPIDYGESGLPRPQSNYEGRFMLGLNWDVAVPVGSVHNFTNNVSPVGFELFFQYFATPNIAVGAGLDWQTYWDSQPRSTYQVENGAVTATADNSIQNGAARAIVRYYVMDRGTVLPFIGGNIGLGWSTFQSAAADLALYDNTLSILLGGELGAAFAVAHDAPLLTLAARYQTLPAADFLAVTNVQSFTFQFGLMSP